MRLPHLQGQKVKSQGGAGAYCGGDLAAQLVKFAICLSISLFERISSETAEQIWTTFCAGTELGPEHCVTFW